MSESILIVEDNPVNLKLSRVLLSLEGYHVRTAADATDALGVLTNFQPQLILMDLQMPGLDGLELTRRLKSDPSHSGILIVAVTAYAMKGDQEKALAAGCDAYVPKPIDTHTLPSVIRELLSRIRLVGGTRSPRGVSPNIKEVPNGDGAKPGTDLVHQALVPVQA